MLCHTKDPLNKVTVTQSAIAGGVAGAVTRAIAQPLDVLKIRLQLQLEPISKGSKYSSLLQTVSSIVKEEGLATLWSGHVPAQLLSISFGAVQFSAYESLTQSWKESDIQFYLNHKHWIHFYNGAVAASFATIISYPLDTVRTRLIAEQKTNKAYKGFSDALLSMIKFEGPKSLFKGLAPTIVQIAPNAGIQFFIYKLFTENILSKISIFQRSKNVGSNVESTVFANVIGGSMAGLVSKTCVYPFDIIKKRLQIQGFQQHRKAFGQQMYCRGTLHCLMLTLNKEGFFALYKGYFPSLLKAVIVSALHFTVYDEIKHVILTVYR